MSARHGAISEAEASPWVEGGLQWLADHANADGGWGDTDRSLSNLSTTTLAWAAFGAVADADQRYSNTVNASQDWLIRHAGGVTADHLGPALIARYGKDRTFSVPILTLCALAGRFGKDQSAWRWVIPLPFELALFPHRFYAALRLPVVSYALPALIAIGQVRHFHAPARNPLIRALRHLSTRPTLARLKRIQPTNGGFLEATPLTSFVVMSLSSAGYATHPVVHNGLDFILCSRRSDSSWPIDTNLATWLTTLSTNALCQSSQYTLSTQAREPIRDWLLRQQYQSRHPYTHASPGGWAWTDLPGGVPDADDTAGAVVALRHLKQSDQDTAAASHGIEWLLGLQNRDGGIPTFCRGWGKLPFDQSSPDLTAHALRAWSRWLPDLSSPLQSRVRSAIQQALHYLARSQKANGTWSPLWFGNQHARHEENLTLGTSRVLSALQSPAIREFLPGIDIHPNKALQWLMATQNGDGGWGGDGLSPSSVEETGLALQPLLGRILSANCSLTRAEERTLHDVVSAGAKWLIVAIESGALNLPAPIGLYFARLWYYERLYPKIFALEALIRLDQINSEVFEATWDKEISN